MAEKDRVLESLRVWVATVWADGTLSASEREALDRLIGYAAMPIEYKHRARQWLEQPVALEVGDLTELSPVRKQFIYDVAAKLTKIDLEVDAAERHLLEKLRLALEVPVNEAGEVELGVEARRDESEG